MYNSILYRVILDLFSRGSFFLINILLARALTVGEFGRFGYALSIGQIFYVFTDLGTHLVMIKELGENRLSKKNIWMNYFSLKLILLAATFVIYLLSIRFFWRWGSLWIPILSIFWIFSNSIYDFIQSVCNGLDRVDIARNLLLVQRGIAFVVVLILVLLFSRLSFIMIGLALAGIVGAVLAIFLFLKLVNNKAPIEFNKAEWAKILMRALPIGVGGLFGIWSMRWGHLVSAWELTPNNLGDYTAAYRLFEFSFIIPASVMNIVVPHLSESLQIGIPEFKRKIKKVFILMIPAGFLWAAVLVLGAEPLIHQLFGKKYSGAVDALRLFGFAGSLVFVNYALTHILIVFNSQKRNALHEFLVCLIIFVATIVFVPVRGINGAALAIIMGEIALTVLTVYFLWAHWGSLRKINTKITEDPLSGSPL